MANSKVLAIAVMAALGVAPVHAEPDSTKPARTQPGSTSDAPKAEISAPASALVRQVPASMGWVAADGKTLLLVQDRFEVETLDLTAKDPPTKVELRSPWFCHLGANQLAAIEEGTVRTFALPDLRPKSSIEIEQIRCLDASPDGSQLALAGRELSLWRVANSTRIAKYELPAKVQYLCYSPDGLSIAAAVEDRVEIFHAATLKHRQTLTHDRQVEIFSFSADSKRLAVGVAPKRDPEEISLGYTTLRVPIWNLSTGTEEPSEIHLNGLSGWAAYTPDGKWLLTKGRSRLSVWDAKTLKEAHAIRFPAELVELQLSRDGKLLVACDEKQVSVWSFEKLLAAAQAGAKQ